MASLGRPAGQGVGIAGRIDAAGVGADQDQRSDRADGRVGERRQAGLDPARGDLGVVVEQLDELPAGRGDAGIGGGAEAAVLWRAGRAGPGDSASPASSAVPSVEASSATMTSTWSTAIGGQMPRDARQAGFQEQPRPL